MISATITITPAKGMSIMYDYLEMCNELESITIINYHNTDTHKLRCVVEHIILLFTDSWFIYTVAPAIQNGPQDLSVPERSIAFFSCLADSSVVPRPSVTWSKDGAVLDISGSSKYMVNTRSGRLFISNVMAADEGVYSCELENIAGNFTSNPGGRLTVNSETGTLCVDLCVLQYSSKSCGVHTNNIYSS